MRIAITTMLWGRHDLFRVWAIGIHRIINTFPSIDWVVTVAGSEGRESELLVRSCGFEYIETPNEPIGRKANMRLQFTKMYKPDYVLFCGSDDFFCNSAIKLYCGLIKKGYNEIAPLDIYYLTPEKQIAYSHGYQGARKGEPVAVGRMLSSKILDKLDWRLWDDSEDMYLDGHSRDKIWAKGKVDVQKNRIH